MPYGTYQPPQCLTDTYQPPQCRTDTYQPPQCLTDTYQPPQCRTDTYQPSQFKSKGGGVALHINENLVSRHHDILPDTECEAIWVKISLSKNSHLLVEVCYRSPSSTTEENMQLTKVIETAANNCALIFGDFKYPSIDWENLDADNSKRHFLNLVTDSFLTQHVSSSTRGSNILDLVFTTEPGMVKEVQVRKNLANCDHKIT